MDKKTINILLSICSIALLAAGLIFLCISVFGDTNGGAELRYAIDCVLLGSLFNIIRCYFNKQDE